MELAASRLVHADGAAAPAVTGSIEDARECPESVLELFLIPSEDPYIISVSSHQQDHSVKEITRLR